MESYVRILFCISVLGCLAVAPLRATTDLELSSHNVQPLSYRGEALFVTQVEAQENRLLCLAQSNRPVSSSDLRATLSPSCFVSAAACAFSWGIGAGDAQEKYARFAQATRYVSVVWSEREALSLPREFIAAPYYASLFARNEEDKLGYFNLWRVWEKDYSGAQPVIGLQTLKRDARVLHNQAQKLYNAKPKEGWSELSCESGEYKNLTLKAVTLWKEVLDKSAEPTTVELLECLENCLLMRRISVPYSGDYNVYAAQVLEQFLALRPASTPQEYVQGATYNLAVGMLFNSYFGENFVPTYRPQVFKEQHLNNGYNLLQKIDDTDFQTVEDVRGIASLYGVFAETSCRAGFSQACYARAAELYERGLEMSLDKSAFLYEIIGYYTYASQSLLSPEMFSSKEVTSWQNWHDLLTGSPRTGGKISAEKEATCQIYLEKIKNYSEKLKEEKSTTNLS